MSTKKKGDALTAPGQSALMQRPAFITEGAEGTEDISVDDLKLPRLAIAQGLSPQMLEDDSAHIEGLKMIDLFNDLTNEIYGRGPITFVVCKRQVKRIEFDPEDRKVPLDLDVPAGDPRLSWTQEDGKGVPPRATKFVEFIIAIVHPDGREPEPVVLSIQESNRFQKKAHERLSGFIKMRRPPAPIYAGLYTVESKPEKNDKGTFGVFVINNAGFVQDEKLYDFAKSFHHSLDTREVVVDRTPGEDDFPGDGADGADTGGM